MINRVRRLVAEGAVLVAKLTSLFRVVSLFFTAHATLDLCNSRGLPIPGRIWFNFQLEFIARVVKAEDRAVCVLGPADSHFVGIICRPCATGGDGFLAAGA